MSILVSAVGFVIVGASKSWIGIPFAFLPWIAYYFISPLLLSDLHKELPSGQRAAGESFISLAKGTFSIPVALSFSFLADHISIFAAYTAIGVIVAIYFIAFPSTSYRTMCAPHPLPARHQT